MCTVSFLPVGDGLHLVMNRDEQLARPAALPPEAATTGSLRSLYPRELGGGTWIGINEAGLAFALINWYARPPRVGPDTTSRGEVIPILLGAATTGEAARLLRGVNLGTINPFRLVVASVRERALGEWRWAGEGLRSVAFPWRRRHWFSSGFDEAEAGRVRRLACARMARRSPADSPEWLRALHGSHDPSKGAFSICMHRRDAATVSCTELSMGADVATMTYSAGPVCERGPRVTSTLPLAPPILRRAA